ncbi:DUF3060 domain-containing protein, partial [Candidatus Pacearchaeota archaeon]|nr:DUF3060 domain-containing protein [Candidatus Pacearchaeota archaeon]
MNKDKEEKKDSIDIEGDKDNIEVSNVEDIEVKGKDNTIKVEGEDKDIKIKGDDNIIDIREKPEKDLEKRPELAEIREKERKKEERKYAREERDFKRKTKDIFNVLTKKKNVIALLIVFFLVLIYISASIRVSNLPLLEDSTTGKKIPLALDPYYFLRIAETKVANGGVLPECDNFRVLGEECIGWSSEILPSTSIGIYKIGKIFDSEFTLRYAHIINPVIFFILSLIAFFFLIYILTNSKTSAFIGGVFLAFVPSYLYRSMAGFADHESIGMFAFFLLLIGFGISMKYLNKKRENKEKYRNKLYKTLCLGLLVGFLSYFTIVSCVGIAKFLFMIIHLSCLIFWFVKRKEKKFKKMRNIFSFYISWVISTIVFTSLFSRNTALGIVQRFMLSSDGIISFFVLGFLIIDLLIIFLNKKKILKIKEKNEIFYSL